MKNRHEEKGAMAMRHNRRWFLRTLGAGAAFISLPEISPVLNLIGFSGSALMDIDPTIESILLGRETGGAFTAHAETYMIEGTPAQLLGAPEALLEMLNQQGLKKGFSGNLDLREASGCRKNYENHETVWRGRGFGEFTDVARPSASPDSSIVVAGKVSPDRTLFEAEGATQHEDHPSVALSGNDPACMLAGCGLIMANSKLTAREAAQGLSAIDKRSVSVKNGQTAIRYETPVSSYVHLPVPRQSSRVGRRSRGVIFAHNKKDRDNPNNIYFADVYV